ncbi:MFS transporter, partial [Chromobacterium subtsugae]
MPHHSHPQAGLPALLTLSAGMFMAILDTNIVNLALPELQRGLHASLSQLTWVVDAYVLTFAGLMLSAGWLADRLGARKVFAWGLGLFVLTSLLCGLAANVELLIGARLLQGMAAALFMPSSLGLLRHAFPQPAERARAVGVFGGLVATAAAAGPVLGG